MHLYNQSFRRSLSRSYAVICFSISFALSFSLYFSLPSKLLALPTVLPRDPVSWSLVHYLPVPCPSSSGLPVSWYILSVLSMLCVFYHILLLPMCVCLHLCLNAYHMHPHMCPVFLHSVVFPLILFLLHSPAFLCILLLICFPSHVCLFLQVCLLVFAILKPLCFSAHV